MDAHKIMNFSWNNIENRLNELREPQLVRVNDAGESQTIPWTRDGGQQSTAEEKVQEGEVEYENERDDDDEEENEDQENVTGKAKEDAEEKEASRKDPVRRLDRLVVLAVAFNNRACAHDLPCEFTAA